MGGRSASSTASRRVASLVAIALGGAIALAVEVVLRFPVGNGPALATRGAALAGGLVVGTFGAGLAVLAYRAESHRHELAELVAGTDDLFRSVGLVIGAEQRAEAVDELLSLLLERVRRGSDAIAATALLISEDGSLRGLTVGLDGEEDTGLWPGAINEHDLDKLLSLEGPTVLDLPQIAKLDNRHLRALKLVVAGAPLVGQGGILGVLLIGKRKRRPFSAEQLAMLQLGADRVAASVDRSRLSEAERRSRLGAEHARKHVSLQSDASLELAAALDDYRPGLKRLSHVLVPSFADLCVVDIRNPEGEVETLVREGRRTVMTRSDRAQTFGLIDVHEGRLWYTGCSDDDELASRLARIGKTKRLTSILVAPIQVGGLGVGTLTLATRDDRRGFRPSDLRVAQDLARRIAIALERVWLYQAERQARLEAALFADRLQRLTDTELEISRALVERDLVEVAVEKARWVLDGTEARIRRRAGHGTIYHANSPSDMAGAQCDTIDELLDLVCATNRPHRRGTEIAAPLVDASGANQGAIAVARADGKFLAADSHLLLTLSQTVSTCLLKAELLGEVRRNETKLRELLEASPLATVELSPQGVFRRCNAAATRLLGWPLGPDIPRESALEALSPWLSPLLLRAAGGTSVVGVSVEWHDRQLEVSCVPLWEQTEWVRGVLLVAADVTERHRLWAELRDAQRTEAVSELAGGVAHDFNNLLTVILGYTGMLIPSFESTDRNRSLLESIERAGLRAAELTNQLLTIGRRQVPRTEFVDPAALVRTLHDVIDRLCGVDIEVEVSSVGDTGHVLIDPAQLEQVILNLVMNARDAMPRGGKLSLVIKSAADDPHWVLIEVSDTGEGMDTATCARCFEPFFTTKPRQHGTGLGLAAVQGVVEQAEGVVTVESYLGSGTTFQIRLPRATETTQIPVPARASTPAARDPGTEVILLVEDEDDVRQLARDVLQDRGYTVLTAANAAEASELYLASNRPVHLLLTDVILPGMRGPELADELRIVDPNLPVVFISGFAAESTRRLGSGTPFLTKPFSPDALASLVRQTLAAAVLPPTSLVSADQATND